MRKYAIIGLTITPLFLMSIFAMQFLGLFSISNLSLRLNAQPNPSGERTVLAASARQNTFAGPLRVQPTNPRYFTDDTGKAIYLAGSHTWSNFQDTGATYPPVAFDYSAYLDDLAAKNHNFFRFWAWEQAKWGPWLSEDIYFSPMMYQRVGPELAVDGQPKFDVSQFNEAYFSRMRTRVEEAQAKGFYVSIMLFDGWSIEDKGLGGGNPWLGHPYHRDNNINNVDGDPNGDNQGHEIHTLTVPAITALQEAYVRKVVDTVNDLDNVLYEISNESFGDSTAWQYHMIEFIHEYEASKPKQHPVGMTVEWPNGDNNDLFASSADWISPNNYFEPPAADGQKVIVNDTDHLWGIGGDRQWVWKSFLRGTNPIFMDPYDCSPVWPPDGCVSNNPEWVSLRENLGYTKAYADRVNLVAMTPRDELASSGYCLANSTPGKAEYLVYLPAGTTFAKLAQRVGIDRDIGLYLAPDSSVSVDLSDAGGTLSVEWFNPETGEAIADGTVSGGAVQSFTAPFAGDAVLYLYQEQTPPPDQPYKLFLPVIGQGEVSVVPPGPYASGESVSLTATPATDWEFAGWSGDLIGMENPISLTVTGNMTVTAAFTETVPSPQYALTVNAIGEGTVSATPEGPYDAGQIVSLAATAAPGWRFQEWSGDLMGTDNPKGLFIEHDSVVTATFMAIAHSYSIYLPHTVR